MKIWVTRDRIGERSSSYVRLWTFEPSRVETTASSSTSETKVVRWIWPRDVVDDEVANFCTIPFDFAFVMFGMADEAYDAPLVFEVAQVLP